MNRFIFVFLLSFFLFAATGCSGQKEKKYSLLTWEQVDPPEGVISLTQDYILVKYIFSDTGYTRKVLFRTNYYAPHYADYPTKIYDDRYLINSTGDIFDLDSNKYIHTHIGFDDLIEKRGDSVLMWHRYYEPSFIFPSDSVRHSSIKTQYYFFDLRTKKIVQIGKQGTYHDYNSHNEELFGIYRSVNAVISPDGNKMAYFVPHKDHIPIDSIAQCGWSRIFPTRGDIFIKYATGDSVKIADSVVFNFSIWSGNFTPVYWLSDNEILTQKKNGALVKITIKPYSVTEYPPIRDAYFCSFPTSFERVVTGQLYYYCGAQQGTVFEVNTTNNSLRPIPELPLSSGYSVKFDHINHDYVKGYFFEGRNILSDTTATMMHSISGHNKIAIQCREVIPSRNQYQHWNTIKIFDPATSKWMDIKIPYLKQMIGWVEER